MSTLLDLACSLVVVMLWNWRQRFTVLLMWIVHFARHYGRLCRRCRRRRCLFIIIRRRLRSRDFWRRRNDWLCRAFFVRNVHITQRWIFWNYTTYRHCQNTVSLAGNCRLWWTQDRHILRGFFTDRIKNADATTTIDFIKENHLA